MKTINKTLLFLLFSVLVFSCNKEPDYHPLSQEAKDWGLFQEGSYWIYQIEETQEYDTITIENVEKKEMSTQFKKLLQNEEEFDNYFARTTNSDFIEIRQNYDNFRDNYFECISFRLNNEFQWLPFIIPILKWENGILINNISNHDFWAPISGFKEKDVILPDTIAYNVVNEIDEFQLKDTIFKNVLHLECLDYTYIFGTQEFYKYEIWLAKNNWIIKMIIRSANINETWTLVESHIVQ